MAAPAFAQPDDATKAVATEILNTPWEVFIGAGDAWAGRVLALTQNLFVAIFGLGMIAFVLSKIFSEGASSNDVLTGFTRNLLIGVGIYSVLPLLAGVGGDGVSVVTSWAREAGDTTSLISGSRIWGKYGLLLRQMLWAWGQLSLFGAFSIGALLGVFGVLIVAASGAGVVLVIWWIQLKAIFGFGFGLFLLAGAGSPYTIGAVNGYLSFVARVFLETLAVFFIAALGEQMLDLWIVIWDGDVGPLQSYYVSWTMAISALFFLTVILIAPRTLASMVPPGRDVFDLSKVYAS